MRFEGSIVALLTPWTSEAQPDLVALARLIEWQIASGTDALVIAGSTGESASLEEPELEVLWEASLRAADGRIKLLAGTGSPATARAKRLTAGARKAGMHGALVVTPAYVRPTQEGLYQHYLEVAEVGLPILLYNVPGRTVVDLLPETVARLSTHPQIVGIKEAVAEPQRLQELTQLRTADFVVLSGDDPSALTALKLGFDGVISVAANAVPAVFAAMVHAAQRGDWALAERIDAGLRPLYEALALEPNPIPVKYAVARLGHCSAQLRLPLLPLSPGYHSIVDTALAAAVAIPTTDPGKSHP